LSLREAARGPSGEREPRAKTFDRATLGDSVLGGSALLEHAGPGSTSGSPSVPRARASTLAAALAGQESARGRHVESLAADGMLPRDLEAEGHLIRASSVRASSRALVVLNFRMFSGEFDDPAKSLSRDFLAPALASDGVLPASKKAGGRIERSFPEWALRSSTLLRSTAMLKSLWYFPTRRDFFRRAAERVLGADSDPEIQEAALRLKVAPYYRQRWSASSPAFASLDRSLRVLAAVGPVSVVLTPQNPDFVEDREVFGANRAVLADYLATRGIPGLSYADWADRYSADRFLDHCHLTAAGNSEYADALARWMER